MKLIFERGIPGTSCGLLPPCDVARAELTAKRELPLNLPELTEGEISRHYTELESQVFGVNSGYYPLGSCTMKYNPKLNEEMAGLPGFAEIHPLQPAHTTAGCAEALKLAEEIFCEITGMDSMSFQPAAGAHGELTGLILIKNYHGSSNRDKILVPDTAHGTNPASVTMAGFKAVSVPSGENGLVDLDALRKAAGPDTAGLMLTNPNTLGLFEKDILEIADIIHNAGGLLYYDGANLNPIMGIARPGDMGFDVVHLNLHKTFATPHGGGGPGSGPVGCKAFLAPFMPKVKAFYGNFTVVVKALTYVLTLGREGIPEAAQSAVLNANYMMKRLDDLYKVAFPGCMGEQSAERTTSPGHCMHEFVLTAEPLKKETGVSALDIAKGLLDNGMHPPTIYFPINVHEALMIEPTETESKASIDAAADIYRQLYELAHTNPQALRDAPMNTPVRRLDEVTAAREPILRYKP